MCTSDGPPKPQEALPPANRSSSTRSSDHSSSGTHKLVNCSRRIVRNLKELTGSEGDSEHPVRPHTERRPSRPGPEGRRLQPSRKVREIKERASVRRIESSPSL